MPADKLLARLEGVRRIRPGRWIARCPAHDDKSPSLGIDDGDDGRTLVNCRAGCETPDVMAAVGLHMSDLFDKPLSHHAQSRLRYNETRAYYEAVVEICEASLRRGERLSRHDIENLKRARTWLERHPITEDWR